MKRLNQILMHLPIVVFLWWVLMLLAILFRCTWYSRNFEIIDYIESYVMFFILGHGFFYFRQYPDYVKSTCLAMISIVGLHLIYELFGMTNFTYYFFYTNILAANIIYLGIRKNETN